MQVLLSKQTTNIAGERDAGLPPESQGQAKVTSRGPRAYHMCHSNSSHKKFDGNQRAEFAAGLIPFMKLEVEN